MTVSVTPVGDLPPWLMGSPLLAGWMALEPASREPVSPHELRNSPINLEPPMQVSAASKTSILQGSREAFCVIGLFVGTGLAAAHGFSAPGLPEPPCAPDDACRPWMSQAERQAPRLATWSRKAFTPSPPTPLPRSGSSTGTTSSTQWSSETIGSVGGERSNEIGSSGWQRISVPARLPSGWSSMAPTPSRILPKASSEHLRIVQRPSKSPELGSYLPRTPMTGS